MSPTLRDPYANKTFGMEGFEGFEGYGLRDFDLFQCKKNKIPGHLSPGIFVSVIGYENFRHTGRGTSISFPVAVNSPVSRLMAKETMVPVP